MRSLKTEKDESVGPFLRWAGGKRWLLCRMPEIIGSLSYNNYYEPFVGGGSIFFGLNPAGKSTLSDLNSELIATYKQVKANPITISRLLKRFDNSPEEYYKLRARKYEDPAKKAAQFIFLNHTSFNGLYRVNSSGEYNVPYGFRESPKIPSEDHLINISKRLGRTSLKVCDFEHACESVSKGDLVFLDPPYTVAHSNNGFVNYNQRLFAFEDQKRLADLIDLLRRKGAYFILTNAYHSSIAELFDRGDRKLITSRGNAIGGKMAKRGSAIEYLFTNAPLD